MTETRTTTKLITEIRRADILIWESRRIQIRDLQNYGDHWVIKGIERPNRHMFTLHYFTITEPLEVEI